MSTYTIEIDLAHDGDESAALHEIAQRFAVGAVVVQAVGPAGGWPVVRVYSESRDAIAALLADRDESDRLGEIVETVR